MLSSRWATVIRASPAHEGLTDVTVSVDGVEERAISYDSLVGHVEIGDSVLLNTTAVDLGLGTGGVHLVIAIAGRDSGADAEGHAMKLRYSPHQIAVDAVEDAHGELLDRTTLSGVPVVILPLHSLLAPVVLAARAEVPGLTIAYVMTDAAALAIAFSRTVPALKGAGALVGSVTTGQAFGGDLEAVTASSGLLAARAVLEADLIVVGMGPGNLGTGSRFGFAALEVGQLVNAVASLEGLPIVVPRLSLADRRERHRGVSHHTVAALTVAALARATVVFPPLNDAQREAFEPGLRAISERHDIVTQPVTTEATRALEASPVPLRSMGRSPDDDPSFFLAGAAAGIYAAGIHAAARARG